MAEVADALTQAHAGGIVHGDIKPGNLMLDDAGRVRILDFGIARRIDVLKTASGPVTPVGTLRYMAPEVLLGARPGPAADIYSLGLMLFELLQGGQAFAGEGDFAVAHRKLSEMAGPVALELAAADPLCALAERMTRRDPAQHPRHGRRRTRAAPTRAAHRWPAAAAPQPVLAPASAARCGAA